MRTFLRQLIEEKTPQLPVVKPGEFDQLTKDLGLLPERQAQKSAVYIPRLQ